MSVDDPRRAQYAEAAATLIAGRALTRTEGRYQRQASQHSQWQKFLIIEGDWHYRCHEEDIVDGGAPPARAL